MTTPFTQSSTKAGFVAIIGEPNVGKSTLMNAILGTKLSIVTPKPQTTRKSVLGIYSAENVQMVFYDTPGVLHPRYGLHRAMMESVSTSLEGADVVLVVLDITSILKSNKTDENGTRALQSLVEKLHMGLEKLGKPIVVALNKMDALFDKKRALPVMDALMNTGSITHVAAISALHNKYVDDLLVEIAKHLPEHDFYYDAELLSEMPQRFFVSEIIRETVFLRYREEIPYSTEINVIEFKEREQGKWYISAEIVVERDTQKHIMIGKGGAALRETGTHARQAIETYLEMPVFLELFVKVREDWRNNQGHLRSFGY